MANFKCKMCGAQLDVQQGQTVAVCSFCGSKQTVANADDERKENLFNRANALRLNCEFDKAILSYQSILSIFPNEPEAYWGLCLCKYGIEYVDDPASKSKKPTIHRVSFESILKDSDYLSALANADAIAKEEYQAEAQEIADIQKNILSISQKEEPFDIFICYKESDEKGKRTPDSVMAHEIYNELTEKGYKVFFARVTLESKLGSMYEPYIFAALNSAKIMLVIGTKKEYFDAVWVKNEWSRFIDLMRTRPDHYLIPCYKDMDAYEMPEEFLSFQAQDLSKLGFMQDLARGIDKIMGKDVAAPKAETKIIQTDVNVGALLKRAEILIGDSNYEKADGLLERALDNDPTNSQAYLLKLVIELKLTSVSDLKNQPNTLEKYSNFQKAYNFADEEQRKKINSINEHISNRNEEARLGRLYDIAIEYKNNKQYGEAEKAFSDIAGYKDATKQAAECVNLGKEDIYKRALTHKERKEYDEAVETFDKIIDFKDSKDQIAQCEELKKSDLYKDALSLKGQGKFDEATNVFMQILNYNDSDFQVDECARLKTEAQKEAVYKSCLFEKEINPYFDSAKLKASVQSLATIPGYKDADQLLVKYEGILKDYEAELTKKKEEQKRARAKKRKKAKKISIIAGSVAALFTGIMLLTFLYLIPENRQGKIQSAIDQKDYESAHSLINENGTYGDTNNLLSMCKAGEAFESLDYETGIDYVYNIGGSVDVTYDTNGGISEKGSESIKRAKKYIDNDADKDGYDFHGWTLTGYTLDAKNHAASIGLQAQYEVITYAINYELNGGVGSDLPTSYNTEEAVSIPNPTKTGYTFLGWTGLDLSLATTDYVLPKGSTGNKTYRATWRANDYKIHLNANGGTISFNEIDVTFDSFFVLPLPTYNGYDFVGWFDNNSTKFESGIYVTASDLYLNASWNTHGYSITYNLNGGENNSNNPITYTIESPDITIKDPTRTGYTFVGWTTNEVSTPTMELQIASGSTGDRMFTANWVANEYTVTVDLNGGECDTTSYTFTFGSEYSIIEPTKVGYVFDKFIYNNDVFDSMGTWSIAADVEVKANWIANADTKYIVNHYTEDLDGKGFTKVDTDNLAGYSDSTITVNANTYEGFTAQKASQEITISADGTTVVDFYYARNSYTISFVTNGGDPIDSKVFKYEEQIPSTLKAVRDGYTFDGWYSDEKQTILFEKMSANDQIVYAYYSEETKASFFSYNFSGQEATITKGNGLSGSVVVPEYIAGKLVTGIGDNAFENCSAIAEITLPDSVDELGSSSFKNCNSLVKINGTSNLSVVKNSTFEGCSSLTYFPDLSNVTSIGDSAFKGCSSLTTIAISDSLTSIGNYAFENCVMLLQTPDLSNVMSIGDYAFKGCTLLTEIKSLDGCATFGEGILTACENIAKITLSFRENIEQFYVSSFFKGDSDTSKYYEVDGNNESTYYVPKRLIEIEYDTAGKTPDYFLFGLTSITKATDKSASSTTIGKHAFDGCTNLTDYTMQNPDVSLIDEYAFQNCTSLTVLPDFQLEEVKKYVFANCSSLLVTPSLEVVDYIGDYAFSECRLITSIKVSNASYMGLNSLYGCSALTELEVPFVGTSISSTEAFGVIFGATSYDNSYSVIQLSKTYYVPNGLTKLTIGGTSIPANSCMNLTSVTTLIVPDSVKTIENGAFKGFDSLESITIPFVGEKDGAAGHNAVFGYIFGYSYSFDYDGSVKADEYDTDYGWFLNKNYGVKDGGVNQYNDCPNGYGTSCPHRYWYYIPAGLSEVTITVQTSLPIAAFNNCNMLQSITLPATMDEIGAYAFQNCTILSKINSDTKGVFNVSAAISKINDYSFHNCSLVEILKISNSVTSIGKYAFAGCVMNSKFNSSNDAEMMIPNSCIMIDAFAFEGMALITNVVVPDSVETIENGAFKGFDSLESITIPFVGEKDGAAGHNAVFGYIFGYSYSFDYDGSVKADEYDTDYGWFLNKNYGVKDGGVNQYNDCPNGYGTSCPHRYWYYIPAGLSEVTITVQTSLPIAAFNNCNMLQSITLPATMDEIGAYAFQNCTATANYLIIPSISSAWNGTSIATTYHGGTGTQSNPYQIFSAKEFIYFLNQIRNGETYEGFYFVLTSKINLGGFAIDSTSLTEVAMFKGILDGKSHRVFNFSISATDNTYNGLFGYMGGTIKNIGFEVSMSVTTSKTTDVYVGMIVGSLSGTLENVYVTGSLTSTSLRTSYVGGLIGYNTGTITNSYSNVTITATSSNLKCYAGGLIGYNDGTISGSFAYGDVSAKGYAESYSYASGLAAAEGTNSEVTLCFRYNSQTITKFGSISTSYNNIGVEASLEDIVSYCKTNWNGDVWSFKKALPSF